MAKIICVNCGVKISFMRGDKTPKVCPRCKKNPSVKETKEEKVGKYKKPKHEKYFKDSVIEDVKDADSVPEMPESDWPDSVL